MFEVEYLVVYIVLRKKKIQWNMLVQFEGLQFDYIKVCFLKVFQVFFELYCYNIVVR